MIYLSLTRPDIAFSVSIASQFMHVPTQRHLDAVNHILRYLKGTPRRGLLFRKCDNHEIECYTNEDWAGVVKDSKSTSGYFTKL